MKQAPVLPTIIGAQSSMLQAPAAYVLSLPTLIFQVNPDPAMLHPTL